MTTKTTVKCASCYNNLSLICFIFVDHSAASVAIGALNLGDTWSCQIRQTKMDLLAEAACVK